MSKSAKVRMDATDASVEQAPTIIEILIDETASMGSVRGQTISAFNEFIDDQKKLADASCQVTMTKFSSAKVSTPYEMIDIAMVPSLSSKTFIPGGMTNLYDTILQRISALKEKIGSTPCNVLFLVLTDGDDNQSSRPLHQVKVALSSHMEEGWTFVYLGAHQRALQAGLEMGFPAGNIKSFSNAEIEQAFAKTSHATTAYRSARSSGAVAVGTSSLNYYGE